MDIIDKYQEKKLKLKDYIFQLTIHEAFKTEYYIDVNFIKAPSIITPDIFVQILQKLKPSLNEFDKVVISHAYYNWVRLFPLLGIDDTTYRSLSVDDEIKRFQNLKVKQIDLSEPLRIAEIRKKKVIPTLEYLTRKHTKVNGFDISLSYQLHSSIQEDLIPAIFITITIAYYDPKFRYTEQSELFKNFKQKVNDELIEYSPIDFKTYDHITILTQPLTQ